MNGHKNIKNMSMVKMYTPGTCPQIYKKCYTPFFNLEFKYKVRRHNIHNNTLQLFFFFNSPLSINIFVHCRCTTCTSQSTPFFGIDNRDVRFVFFFDKRIHNYQPFPWGSLFSLLLLLLACVATMNANTNHR
jgi:hypothetical protein